ncbi:hypothetical protein H2248_001268 [Termitomyces sp. 'cryptogamus']|nr:hypothetical protein H2248_001268 [Termitomyces sp. 'cryptogamus']
MITWLLQMTSDWVSIGMHYNPPMFQFPDHLYRPTFLEAIIPMLNPRLVHMEQRCISVSTLPSGSHVLEFADGSTYEADLVIAADGIKSVLRDFVSEKPTSLVYSNRIARRSVIPSEALKAVKTDIMRPLTWIGKNKHIVTYPVEANQKINVVLFSTDSAVPIGAVNIPLPWVKPTSQDELQRDYSGWGEDANIIIKEMKNPSKWYLHFLHPPLSSYVRQRVVLVGDAAHAMLPHLGSGVGQGLEDVYALCSLIGDPRAQKSHLDAALKAYDSIRVTRANMVQSMSTVMGDVVAGRGPGGGTIPQIQEQLKGVWHPIWHHDLVGEVKRAVANAYGPRGVL